jgi:hypothetical protein
MGNRFLVDLLRHHRTAKAVLGKTVKFGTTERRARDSTS